MSLRCPRCDEEMEYNGRSYDCEECDTRWVPHNLTVSREVSEMAREMHQERKDYEPTPTLRERLSGWLYGER